MFDLNKITTKANKESTSNDSDEKLPKEVFAKANELLKLMTKHRGNKEGTRGLGSGLLTAALHMTDCGTPIEIGETIAGFKISYYKHIGARYSDRPDMSEEDTAISLGYLSSIVCLTTMVGEILTNEIELNAQSIDATKALLKHLIIWLMKSGQLTQEELTAVMNAKL